MKKITLLGLLLSLSLGIYAQNDPHAGHDMKMESATKPKIDSEVQASLTKMLNNYYGLKNALIADDVNTASTQAGELTKTLAAMPMAKMTADQHTLFMSLSGKIKTDAQGIAEAKDVKKQRTYLYELSTNFYALIKGLKANESPVYQQYCPMAKGYWLSDNAAVKNPYYGKMMLTCGKVTETLK
jgi:hypothetical protein